MRDIYKIRYRSDRDKATNRGVAFLLTFDEWRDVWADSGKWAQRGLARDQYRMVRLDKAGAFEIGNVRIWQGGGPHQRGRDFIRLKYKQHENAAKARGIPFLLTFEEWWDIWQASGKWDQRGRRGGEYCMARLHDRGGYERDNVKICLTDENHRERVAVSGEAHSRPGTGQNYFAALSPERQNRLRQKLAANGRALRGKAKSDHMRATLSQAVIGRRIVVRDSVRCWSYPGDADYPG